MISTVENKNDVLENLKKIIEERNKIKDDITTYEWCGMTCPKGGWTYYKIFENHEQVPELQKPWFLKFVEFLEENNVDVINSTFEFPDLENSGRWKKAKLIKIEDGYNRSME